jgi:multiple sugar transport system ATP-binding protein
MRAEIAGLQRKLGVTSIYVTHDQVEAMTMGTRIAVMHGGLLRQQGPPQKLYDAPDNIHVATLIGTPAMNLLQARIEHDGRALHCMLGGQRLPLSRANESVAALAGYAGAEVAVGIRPEHLREPTAGLSEHPRLRGRVQLVELLGSERLVQIEIDAEPLLVEQDRKAEPGLDGGSETAVASTHARDPAVVNARFDPHVNVAAGDLAEVAVLTERLHFFDLRSGQAIR